VTGLFRAGEKLQDTDVDSILKFTGTEEDLDGNIKYEGTNDRPQRSHRVTLGTIHSTIYAANSLTYYY